MGRGVGPIFLAQKFLELGARRDPEPVANDRLSPTLLEACSASLKCIAKGGIKDGRWDGDQANSGKRCDPAADFAQHAVTADVSITDGG